METYLHQPPFSRLDPFINSNGRPSTIPYFRVLDKYATDECHSRWAITGGRDAGVFSASPAPNFMTIAPISLSLLSSLTVVASICLREELKKDIDQLSSLCGNVAFLTSQKSSTIDL